MRIVRHPNIVELKAFYYSNGDRVRQYLNGLDESGTPLTVFLDLEGRSLSKSRSRIRA